jgi:hypothetical protein
MEPVSMEPVSMEPVSMGEAAGRCPAASCWMP